MITDIIDTIHAKRVDKCFKSAKHHEYSRLIPNKRFLCELLHIKRVKYNNFYYTLDMIYLIVTEPRKANQYFQEWRREVTT
jgi:hypothetical protein